jgi:hypothetical protein
LHPWKNGPNGQKSFQFDIVVPVKGVPFISETRCTKNISQIKRDSSSLIIMNQSQTIDAPYSDTFVCRELWIVHGAKSRPT